MTGNGLIYLNVNLDKFSEWALQCIYIPKSYSTVSDSGVFYSTPCRLLSNMDEEREELIAQYLVFH